MRAQAWSKDCGVGRKHGVRTEVWGRKHGVRSSGSRGTSGALMSLPQFQFKLKIKAETLQPCAACPSVHLQKLLPAPQFPQSCAAPPSSSSACHFLSSPAPHRPHADSAMATTPSTESSQPHRPQTCAHQRAGIPVPPTPAHTGPPKLRLPHTAAHTRAPNHVSPTLVLTSVSCTGTRPASP